MLVKVFWLCNYYSHNDPMEKWSYWNVMNSYRVWMKSGIEIRKLERKLPDEACAPELELYKKMLAQEKNSKNKIYSLHEPEVYCMSKGKAHKKYEYGNKASVVLTQKTGIIVGAKTFRTNVYDGHTLEDVLAQTLELTGKTPKTSGVDRGYKGKRTVGDTHINIPKPRCFLSSVNFDLSIPLFLVLLVPGIL